MEKMYLWTKRRAFAIGVLLVFSLWGVFVLHNLNSFSVADEQLWIYDRIPAYWRAWKNQDWTGTAINDKPGVTLSIFSGLNFFSTEKLKNNPVFPGNSVESDENRDGKSQKLNSQYRYPSVLVNGLFLLIILWLLKKVFEDKFLTLTIFSAIALSPILLGITQIINPDTFLWSTAFLSFLSLLVYLKTIEKKFVLLSGLFLGLAILSKYTATIFYPFFFAVILTNLILLPNKLTLVERNKRWLFAFGGYLSIIFISILTVIAGMPATLFVPNLLWQSTLGYPGMWPIVFPLLITTFLIILGTKVFPQKIGTLYQWIPKVLAEWPGRLLFLTLAGVSATLVFNFLLGRDFFRLNDIPFDINFFRSWSHHPMFFGKKFFLEMRPLIFSVSPIILLGAIWLWLKNAFWKTPNFSKILVLSAFIPTFIWAVIQKDLLITVRYSIVLYPFFLTLGAIGIYDLMATLWPKKGQIVALGAILTASLFSLYSIRPFYFNYTSDLLPKKYLISDAWGQGGNWAAQYLNHLPNATNLTVWTDYYGVCDYFVGQCVAKTAADQVKMKVDYLVLTRRGYIRYLEREITMGKKRKPYAIKEYYQKNNPVWELQVDGRPDNYTKIFKVEE